MAEEGLKQTQNKLIHIGCPIPFDIDEFLVNLEKLMDMSYKNDENIVTWLKKKVLTINIDQVVGIKVSTPNRGLVGKEARYIYKDFWKQQMEIVRAFLERSQYQEMEDKEH